MKCHSVAIPTLKENALKRVAVIGMPNTGKSTLFNRITGATAFVGNWPGVTVDLLQAKVKLEAEIVEFVDLPGIYDLNGFSDDEKVVQHFLESFPIDLVIVVLNASQIDRQILMPLQIKALGLPAVVMLNMADEAKRYGINIDVEQLSDRLQMPVFLISAKYGKNHTRAMAGIVSALKRAENSYLVSNLKTYFSDNRVTPEEMEGLLSGTVQMPSISLMTFTNKMDQVMMHPIFGLPIFFISMLGVFWIIWNIGLPSQDLMGTLSDGILNNLIKPIINPLPEGLQDFIVNGLWNGIATLASFLPLIIIFFFVMAILEDSGYLSRAAYLMDILMSKVGLDGRAFVMQMMGFGCNVPALMGTRVIRSRPMRLLAMLIIPFALCSARLTVFVFIIAAVFPDNRGAFVLFSLYILSFVASFLAAAIFSRTQMCKSVEPFVLELPPYRMPTLKQVLLRAWGEVKEFLRQASGFIALGCITVWFLTNFPPQATALDTLGGRIGVFLQPIMAPIGINPYLTLALIFGFVAKEVVVGALATIYGMNANAIAQELARTITPIQAYSFCIFCLLYTPCLTTIATLKSESKSWGYTLLALGFALSYAWICSFIFYQGAKIFGF